MRRRAHLEEAAAGFVESRRARRTPTYGGEHVRLVHDDDSFLILDQADVAVMLTAEESFMLMVVVEDASFFC